MDPELSVSTLKSASQVVDPKPSKDKIFDAQYIGTKTYCKERVQRQLRVYEQWVQSLRENALSVDEAADLEELLTVGGRHGAYSVNELLADFNLLIENDDILGFGQTEAVCDGAGCFIAKRHHRPRDRQNDHDLFSLSAAEGVGDGQSGTQSVAIQQVMDSLHFAVRHRERVDVEGIVRRIRSEQPDDDEDADFNELCHDKLTAAINHIESNRKYSGWRRERAKQQKHSKFTTSSSYTATRSADGDDDQIEDEAPRCFLEMVADDLESFGVEQPLIEALRALVVAERHDTDSFLDDVDGADSADSAFWAVLCQSAKGGLSEALSDRIFEYRAVNEQYSSSFRFFYWPYYKENEAESNMIPIGIGVFEQNPGYKLMDWFVAAKYVDFKTEITSNLLSGLSQMDWNETLKKATIKLTAYNKDPNRRPLVCGWIKRLDGKQGYPRGDHANMWHKPYGLKRGDNVTISHIMSLLFYTNFTAASYEFSASFRRRFWNETDGALKRRHSAFAHQARLLRELVEAFGNTMINCSVSTFYHGVSANLIFEGTMFNLCGPMSTTSAFDIAHGTFSDESGIVLDIPNTKLGDFLFEALLWSDFSEEREYLFLGGLQHFEFHAVHDVPRAKNYGPFIVPMVMMQKMIKGHPYELCKITASNVKALQLLIDNRVNGVSSCTRTGMYVNKLFRNLCSNVRAVIINTFLMGIHDEHANDRRPAYGYRLFKSLFFSDCDSDDEAVDLSLIFRLFSANLESLVICNLGVPPFKPSIALNESFVSNRLQKALDIVASSRRLMKRFTEIVIVEPLSDIDLFIVQNSDMVKQMGFEMKK